MVLTQRERYIAMAAAALLAGGVVFGSLAHYVSARRSIAADIESQGNEKTKIDNVLKEQASLRKQYDQMGVRNTQAAAKGQVREALEKWAIASGIKEKTLNDGQTSHEGDFDSISFKLSGWGPESTVARLLNQGEFASLPLRVTKLVMNPVNEGNDMVYFELSVSTICKTEKDKNNRTRAGLDSIPLRGDRL